MSFLSFILVGLSEGAPIRRASIRRIQQVTEGYDTRVDFAILNQQLPAMDSISSLAGMLRCDEVRGSSLPTVWSGTTDIEKMTMRLAGRRAVRFYGRCRRATQTLLREGHHNADRYRRRIHSA
jgi:hypothetical protein